MLSALACLALLAADPSADQAAYKSARDAAGRDPDAHVRLALWCEQHEMPAERLRHLALAVMYDPAHAAARGLLGQVRDADGRWTRPGAVPDADRAEALAEYNARRSRLDADDADAHWRLALWCEEHGLAAEARAHLAAVTQLDPGRDAAWTRIGFKKVHGRWMTDDQVAAAKAEADAQAEANKTYRQQLAGWKAGLKDRNKRDDAEAGLASIHDPRAVPAIVGIFITGKNPDLDRAVQLLGQVDARPSSRALAFLAAFAPTEEARRAAGETLRRRDPREYADLLIGLLGRELRYEVRPVGGPGSPGVLFVEGQQFNVQRLYSPPPMPNIPLYAGEAVSYDANGLPVVSRYLGSVSRITRTSQEELGTYTLAQGKAGGANGVTDPAQAKALADFGAHYGERIQEFLDGRPMNRLAHSMNPRAWEQQAYVIVERGTLERARFDQELAVPIGQLALEHAKAAHSAEAQLEADVAALDARNAVVKRQNARVTGLLRDAAGLDLGDDPERWTIWYFDTLGYTYRPGGPTPRPTVTQQVPLAYLPREVAAVPYRGNDNTTRQSGVLARVESHIGSCFAAGTPVHTRDGTRPIEQLRVGDLVLCQDTASGALSYQPVLVTHHNPPAETFRVALAGETITASAFHRFWVAGKGWKMARDLAPGDVLRTLRGLEEVESVESGAVQPVFNLDVASGRSFFVGDAGALVHDNSVPDFRARPFDAPATLAEASAE